MIATPVGAAAMSRALVWSKALAVPKPERWSDVTDRISAALPPMVACGICHVTVRGDGHTLALVNPQHMEIGPAVDVALDRRPALARPLVGDRLCAGLSSRARARAPGAAPIDLTRSRT